MRQAPGAVIAVINNELPVIDVRKLYTRFEVVFYDAFYLIYKDKLLGRECYGRQIGTLLLGLSIGV